MGTHGGLWLFLVENNIGNWILVFYLKFITCTKQSLSVVKAIASFQEQQYLSTDKRDIYSVNTVIVLCLT